MINLGTSTMQDFALGDNLVERIDLGDTTIFDPYTTLTGTLPLTFNSRVAGALKNYRLYGDSDGVGEETENLFNPNTVVNGEFVHVSGTVSSANYSHSDYIPVIADEKYYLKNIVGNNIQVSGAIYDENKQPISNIAVGNGESAHGFCVIPSNGRYIRVNYMPAYSNKNTIMVVKSEVVVSDHIPFGYKIPISLSDGTSTSNYDLFIGSSKLGEDEYLDFSEQKIYKMVSGVLTPVDPPAPLPAINAYQGENTLSSTETVGTVTVKGRISEVTPSP